jgi:hypothetical protein
MLATRATFLASVTISLFTSPAYLRPVTSVKAVRIRPEKRQFGQKPRPFASNPGFFAVFEGFWPFWAVPRAARLRYGSARVSDGAAGVSLKYPERHQKYPAFELRGPGVAQHYRRVMSKTAQPAPETDEKKSCGLGSYVVWAFVAVMVYVLSSGPVVLMAQKSKLRLKPLPYPVLDIIYAPLNWAYNDPFLHKPLGIYFHL